MSETENKTLNELDADRLEAVTGGYRKPPEKPGFFIYQIQKGDKLSRLATRFCCTVEDIMSWNPKIPDRNTIYAGDYLYIKKEG